MDTPKKRKRHSSEPANVRTPKRQRIILTLEKKIELISESETGLCTQSDLAVKYSIGRSSVADILKKREFYKDQYSRNANFKTQTFGKSSKFADLNDLLHDWFKQARSKNIPITGPLLQEKAVQFASELGYQDFKASNGWLDCWKAKFSIKFYKVCGESGDVNNETVTEFKGRIREVLKDTSHENITHLCLLEVVWQSASVAHAQYSLGSIVGYQSLSGYDFWT